jgi:integrase
VRTWGSRPAARRRRQQRREPRLALDQRPGSLPVQGSIPLVMKAVEPLWATKTETASRVRGRIESVLDWAAARGYRQSENPARWRGHLENLLPKKSKVRRVEHHAALPYPEIAGFMAELSEQEGVAALALELTILTAARTGEVLGARSGPSELPSANTNFRAPSIRWLRTASTP